MFLRPTHPLCRGHRIACALLALLALTSCKSSRSSSKPPEASLAPVADPPDLAPTSEAAPLLFENGTVMTAAGNIHSPGFLLLRAGRIAAVGAGAYTGPREGIEVVDAAGHTLTPGLIDTHSHMGVYPMPEVAAHEDGNEMVKPETPEVWAEHAFWPQDPSLSRALAGGITTIQVLPGSGNLIGGRSFVAKLRPRNSARAMRFSGAPQGLKMACGENPKRVYGEKGGPMTRMGNIAHVRRSFDAARVYLEREREFNNKFKAWKDRGAYGDPPKAPERDLGLETLARVLDGTLHVHNHCYRADEMHIMLDLAKAYGFKIRSFHHALEGYKLAERLAAEDVSVSTWADWWGFKMEAYDGIPHNAALLNAAGVRAIIHSDSESDVRFLNQEAAKARRAGQSLGMRIDDNTVLRWVTANPAWALRIDHLVGTLEKDKIADVVMWHGSPFSVYAQVSRVVIDGHTVYQKSLGRRLSDFELGQEGLDPEMGAQP